MEKEETLRSRSANMQEQEKCNCDASCGENRYHVKGSRGCNYSSVSFVEDSEPGPAHEVSDTIKAAILEKHNDAKNYSLERHQRALDFIHKSTKAILRISEWIAKGSVSEVLASKRIDSIFSECLNEAMANEMEKQDGEA